MQKKTRYRTVSNGHWEFLQYAMEFKIIWFKFTIWEYVYKPYYSSIFGRYDSTGVDTIVNSLHNNISNFISNYPDISMYLAWSVNEQKRLESEAAKEEEERYQRAGRVTYL